MREKRIYLHVEEIDNEICCAIYILSFVSIDDAVVDSIVGESW